MTMSTVLSHSSLANQQQNSKDKAQVEEDDVTIKTSHRTPRPIHSKERVALTESIFLFHQESSSFCLLFLLNKFVRCLDPNAAGRQEAVLCLDGFFAMQGSRFDFETSNIRTNVESLAGNGHWINFYNDMYADIGPRGSLHGTVVGNESVGTDDAVYLPRSSLQESSRSIGEDGTGDDNTSTNINLYESQAKSSGNMVEVTDTTAGEDDSKGSIVEVGRSLA